MNAISYGTSCRDPSFSSDSLDDAEIIDPTDSVSQYSNQTIRDSNLPRTHTTQARTKAQHINNIRSMTDDKKVAATAAASSSNKRLSTGGSFLRQKSTDRKSVV